MWSWPELVKNIRVMSVVSNHKREGQVPQTLHSGYKMVILSG